MFMRVFSLWGLPGIVRVTARCPVDGLNAHCLGSGSLRPQTN